MSIGVPENGAEREVGVGMGEALVVLGRGAHGVRLGAGEAGLEDRAGGVG